MSDYISISSYQIVKCLQIPIYYYYLLASLEFLFMVYILIHEVTFSVNLSDTIQQIYIREIFYTYVTLEGKMLVLYILGSFFLIVLFLLLVVAILVVKQDSLLYRENVIINGIFKGLGHVLILNNFVLMIPALMILEEPIRCTSGVISTYQFTCFNTPHIIILAFTLASSLACFILAVYSNLFVNCQFPNKHIPFACWDGKPLVVKSLWKFVYIFHYDILDARYYTFLRLAAFAILLYGMYVRLTQPQIYLRDVNIFTVITEAVILTIHLFIVLEDVLSEQILFEFIPMVAIICIFVSGILIARQQNNQSNLLSKDNRNMNEFQNEDEMGMYVSLLLLELMKLKRVDSGPEYSAQPQVFTILSRHMEHCKNDECICKKYEPEYDKKFSSIGSRRLTMRQSTSFSSMDMMFKKKIPIKISFDTKLQIYKAEISDCIDRFLEEHPKSVGLKLQKSFFNHAFAESSYKALFVQLENSHSCNYFRGKINIYHLKTRIQEEMTQSEASPFSLDITTCLKFEAKRVVFEQTIVELCIVCEGFWNELSQGQNDYNVEKIDSLVLEISKTIISIKDIFGQLLNYNPSSIDAIQNYALIYRYILRDEFRFNDIIQSLNQLKKTNKLEQTRELTSKFFDSDNYAMVLVSGDVKDLGRIVKANRGVEQIFGYMPNELQGNRINKIMPKLFATIHDEFISQFLKRGHSTFIDKNQYLLIENKLRFIQMTLAYVKVMVSLKQGLMFVSFFKFPLKVPINSEGTLYLKAKDAHYILCDSKGYIHGMSNNCMKNLGIPPTVLSKSKSINDASNLVHIEQFASGILGPEYEFNLPTGTNFIFDTSWFKNDKYLQKEFHELTGRMRKYNIYISLKKFEFRLSPSIMQEILLFSIEIISFQLSEAPITIPIDKTDETSMSIFSGTQSSVNNDELRTSKFKEFKVQVQEVKTPSKIQMLKRITITFFILLLGVFSLNYSICVTQNKTYVQRLDILDLLQQLTDKLPSTSRYVRTVIDITNGFESNYNEVITDRFSYYMGRISDNSQTFNTIQEDIYTLYKSLISFESLNITLYDLQTDYTIKTINSSLSSALNMFSSKALQFSNSTMKDLSNVVVPFISYQFINNKSIYASQPVSDIQQDLYFILQNGHQAFPQGLLQLTDLTESKLKAQNETFMTVSLIIAIVSIIFNFIVIPMVYPLLTHYEKLTYFILHSFNRLTKKFIENEIKCCNELFVYIGKKHGSGNTDKQSGAMMKKPEGRRENKQLMRVNPKIPKIVLEQQERKKNQNRKKRARHLRQENPDKINDEEEKELIIKVQRLDYGQEQEDEASGLIDEDLDEEEVKHNIRSNNSNYRTREHGGSIGVSPLNQMNTGSVVSIDESTVRTSVEMNSSTNRSSGDDKSDHDSQSSSSQSNYTQYTNFSQWKAIRNSQFGQAKSNVSFAYDLTQAKSSELQGEYQDPKAELSEEEKEFKKQTRERQLKIRKVIKSRKCYKILFLILLVFLISVYLGVNTMYTRFVFQYENHLEEDISIIDKRQLCYTFSLTLIKEMIARNQSIVSQFYGNATNFGNNTDINRYQLLQCYDDEQNYIDLLLGIRKVNSKEVLLSQYLALNTELDQNQICTYLYTQGNYSNAQKYNSCDTAYDGLINNGMNEVLNEILREEENLLLLYQTSPKDKMTLQSILNTSSLTTIETIKDIFMDDALSILKSTILEDVKTFANQLFRIFDILFAVFVSVCFIIVTFGVFYFIKRLQQLTIQIYHVILLIPYGERTKRELNELLKIKL